MGYKAVRVDRIGDATEITYTTIANLKTKFLSKGKNKPVLLHTFQEYDIAILGYKQGLEKNINKTELPPPIDNELYYGDLIVYSLKDNLTINDYNQFLEDIFQFEDLDDTILEDELEVDSDEDYDYNDGFLVRDSDIEEAPELITTDEELIIIDPNEEDSE